jgi:hypothetical protein
MRKALLFKGSVGVKCFVALAGLEVGVATVDAVFVLVSWASGPWP